MTGRTVYLVWAHEAPPGGTLGLASHVVKVCASRETAVATAAAPPRPGSIDRWVYLIEERPLEA